MAPTSETALSKLRSPGPDRPASESTDMPASEAGLSPKLAEAGLSEFREECEECEECEESLSRRDSMISSPGVSLH